MHWWLFCHTPAWNLSCVPLVTINSLMGHLNYLPCGGPPERSYHWMCFKWWLECFKRFLSMHVTSGPSSSVCNHSYTTNICWNWMFEWLLPHSPTSYMHSLVDELFAWLSWGPMHRLIFFLNVIAITWNTVVGKSFQVALLIKSFFSCSVLSGCCFLCATDGAWTYNRYSSSDGRNHVSAALTHTSLFRFIEEHYSGASEDA